MAYLAAAESLREAGLLLNQFGQAYVSWPPLYPLILSVGVGWMQPFVFLLHLGCGIGAIYLWDKMGGRVLETAEWKFFFLLLLSLSTPFLMIFVFVWSEAVFVLLLSAYLCYLQKFVHTKAGKELLVAALLAFLLLLQRNAGIFLLAGAGAGLLFNYSFFDKKQLKYLLLHALFAVTGFALWNIYVVLVKGNEQIVKEMEQAFSLQTTLERVFSELGRLYVPEPAGFLLGLFVLFPLLLFVGYRLYQGKEVWLRLLIVLLLTYLMVWIVVPAVWVVVPAGKEDISRFLAVSIPLLHLILAFFLESCSKRYRGKARFFILGLAGLWLLYPFLRILLNALLWSKMSGI